MNEYIFIELIPMSNADNNLIGVLMLRVLDSYVREHTKNREFIPF